MKIVDEKGRLFGKINLIDLLVIVLILAVIAVVVWKVTAPATSAEADDKDRLSSAGTVSIEYQVLCRIVNTEIENCIPDQIGDQLMSSGEMVDGTITDCEILPYYETYATGNSVERVKSEDYVDMLFTIKANAPYMDNIYHVGSQEVRIGRKHIVKTVDLELTGTVTSLEVCDG